MSTVSLEFDVDAVVQAIEPNDLADGILSNDILDEVIEDIPIDDIVNSIDENGDIDELVQLVVDNYVSECAAAIINKSIGIIDEMMNIDDKNCVNSISDPYDFIKAMLRHGVINVDEISQIISKGVDKE